jgi:hypothetical protein
VIIADVVQVNGQPVNGATVYAYKASRFSGIPAYDAAPPSGAADAGPVTTSSSYGGQGAFQISTPTAEDYYCSATYAVAGVNHTAWQRYASGGGDTAQEAVFGMEVSP